MLSNRQKLYIEYFSILGIVMLIQILYVSLDEFYIMELLTKTYITKLYFAKIYMRVMLSILKISN